MTRRSVGLLAAVACLLPFCSPHQAVANFALTAALMAALGQSWNIAGGFGGLMSFGQVAFFGVGAYASAILQWRWGLDPWLGLPAAALSAMVVGWIVGWAACRSGLRGSYLALATLAVAEALRIGATSVEFTNAGLGIHLALKPGWQNFQFQDRRGFYAMALALAVVATAMVAWLTRSRFGARLVAVRENSDAARALGIGIVHTQAAAMAMSAGVAGVAGALYLQIYLYIDPSIAFDSGRSVEMLLVALVGGAGTVAGPLWGAVALAAVAEGARLLVDRPGFGPLLYGVVLLAIVAFMPNGLVAVARGRGRA